MPKGSPSQLDLLAQCVHYTKADAGQAEQSDRGKAASEGTLLHLVMQDVVQQGDFKGVALEHNLNEEQAGAVETAWNLLLPDLEALGIGKGIAGFAGALTELELPETEFVRRGFADLVIFVDDHTAILKDWKMVRVEGTHDLQLKTYVEKLFFLYPQLHTVMAGIIAPRLNLAYSQTYTRDQIPAIQAEIKALLDRAGSPAVPATPCDACCFCKWNGNCPAQAGALSAVGDVAALPLSSEVLLNPATPAQRSQRRLLLSWAEDAIDAIKKQDTAWVQAGNTLPGFGLITRKGNKSLPDTATPIAVERLVQTGLPQELVLSACKLSLTKLADALVQSLGDNARGLRKRWEPLLDDLTEPGTGYSYLQRTSRKPIPELFAELGEQNFLDG